MTNEMEKHEHGAVIKINHEQSNFFGPHLHTLVYCWFPIFNCSKNIVMSATKGR